MLTAYKRYCAYSFYLKMGFYMFTNSMHTEVENVHFWNSFGKQSCLLVDLNGAHVMTAWQPLWQNVRCLCITGVTDSNLQHLYRSQRHLSVQSRVTSYVITATSGRCFRSKRAYQRRNPSINNEDTSQNVENDVRIAIWRKISEISSRDVIAATSGNLFRSKRAYLLRNPSINNEYMSQNVENEVRNAIRLQVKEIRG